MSEFHLLNKMYKLHHQCWLCFVYIDGHFTQGLLITVFDGQLNGLSVQCFALAFMSSSNWSVVKMNPAQLTEVTSSGFKGHRLCLHRNTEGKSLCLCTHHCNFFSRQITKPVSAGKSTSIASRFSIAEAFSWGWKEDQCEIQANKFSQKW